MLQVGNQALCGGVNSNVGFYYRVVFPVGTEGDKYAFHLPTDFGNGGFSLVDGEIMAWDTEDIWDGGNSEKLNFEKTFTRGNHILELFGGEGCCDGTTSWAFNVNNKGWEDFTTYNLDMYMINETMPTEGVVPALLPDGGWIYSFPLVDTTIFFITVPFSMNAIDNFDQLHLAFANAATNTYEGYCSGMTDDMTKVSNKDLCGDGASSENIGFYYRVVFPVGTNNSYY